FVIVRPPPSSTLFPYTTLFRSRQLTVQGEAVVGDAQAGRAEGPLRMVLDVEEVGRADVVVALLVVRVDGACVDLRGDRRVGQVLGGDDLAGELPEVAAYLADHHVADGERDVGVILVDVPGARDVAGDRGGGRCGRHRSSLPELVELSLVESDAS